MRAPWLLLLLALPSAPASQPTPELELRAETDGGAGVGEPVTLRLFWRANRDVDVAYRLLVPPFVEVDGDAQWRIALAAGKTARAEVRLVATREAYWSAALEPVGSSMYPTGYLFHARTDATGGAATTDRDASELIPARGTKLELTARALNATRVEYTFAAEKVGAWRADESIAVEFDTMEIARAEDARAQATTSEELGPNTYAFRALRAYAQARFERPELPRSVIDLAIPSRLIGCRDYGFRTEDGAFSYEERGEAQCGEARMTERLVPWASAPLAVALAMALRRR